MRPERQANRPVENTPVLFTLETALTDFAKAVIDRHLLRLVISLLVITTFITLPSYVKESDGFNLTLKELRMKKLDVRVENTSAGYDIFAIVSATRKRNEFRFEYENLMGRMLIEKNEWQIQTWPFLFPPLQIENSSTALWRLETNHTLISDIDVKRVKHLKELIDEKKVIPVVLAIEGEDFKKRRFTAKCQTNVYAYDFPSPSTSDCRVEYVD